jgi:hypothetical protein
MAVFGRQISVRGIFPERVRISLHLPANRSCQQPSPLWEHNGGITISERLLVPMSRRIISLYGSHKKHLSMGQYDSQVTADNSYRPCTCAHIIDCRWITTPHHLSSESSIVHLPLVANLKLLVCSNLFVLRPDQWGYHILSPLLLARVYPSFQFTEMQLQFQFRHHVGKWGRSPF